MDKKPSVDFSVLAPILLGAFSLIGIGVVLLSNRYSNQRAPATPPATETSFRYIYLGTEPGLSTLTPEVTDTPTFTPLPILPPVVNPGITLTPTKNIVPTNIISTSTPVRTATPSLTPTLEAVLSKFDDTYFELLYTGDWETQTDVEDVYQKTLHISLTVGNSVQFTFVGERVYIGYQAGPSLGKVSVNLDGLIVELDESSSTTQLSEWRSAILVHGTHTLQIEHASGGSVNLDSITIPEIYTPTPTTTP